MINTTRNAYCEYTFTALPMATPCSGCVPVQHLHRMSLVAAQGAVFGEGVEERAA
jgi:hypothetical protein